MSGETYVPGFSETALNFMRVRSGESHAAFFLPQLTAGLSLLDCGCGPGTITVDLAAAVAPGEVVGIDRSADQLAGAAQLATERGLAGMRFEQADVYDLPFNDDTFDRAFSNALIEHLAEPIRGLREIRRVLKPGGVIGVSLPEWDDLKVGPASADSRIADIVAAYEEIQGEHGGSMRRGRSLDSLLVEAGFQDPKVTERTEVFPPENIGGLIALLLDDGDPALAEATRAWIKDPDAYFAQTWVEATATA